MARRILVAIELGEAPAADVLSKVASLAAPDDHVEVVHVVDPASIAYSADPTMTGKLFQAAYETAMANARNALEKRCQPYNLPDVHCRVLYGRVAHEVHQLLEQENFDCLMIGSHGWAGWQRLLGSKAASILHGVSVDTWVFKVRELEQTTSDK